MKRIKINSSKLNNWENFHKEFSKKFNFPDYYGKNINAWIDCMDDLVEEFLILDLGDSNESSSKIINALLESVAFVNARKLDENKEPTLIVSMY